MNQNIHFVTEVGGVTECGVSKPEVYSFHRNIVTCKECRRLLGLA